MGTGEEPGEDNEDGQIQPVSDKVRMYFQTIDLSLFGTTVTIHYSVLAFF